MCLVTNYEKLGGSINWANLWRVKCIKIVKEIRKKWCYHDSFRHIITTKSNQMHSCYNLILKITSSCFWPWSSIMEVSCRIQTLSYNVVFKYPMVLCWIFSVYYTYIGWSRYTGIITKVVIEHIKVRQNIQNHKSLAFTL